MIELMDCWMLANQEDMHKKYYSKIRNASFGILLPILPFQLYLEFKPNNTFSLFHPFAACGRYPNQV